MTSHPIPILLVEDNPDHAELTMQALKRSKLINQIFHVKDGEEALQFLFRQGPYADREKEPRPGLILLDLRLPKADGLEVLRRVKADPALRSIPTVMLTTIEEREEMKKAYELGANSYVTKPVQFSEFMEKVQAIGLYWLLTNAQPQVEVRDSSTPGVQRPVKVKG